MTGIRHWAAAALYLALSLTVADARAQASVPSFSKVFQPDTIGPGSASLLRFQINNDGGMPATGLAFTDVLPAGVTLASPAHPTTTCSGGLVAAPDGGTTISFSNGSVGGNNSCSVSVYVTSATPGTHINVSGGLTSSAGSSGTATDDLTVAINRPGFSKSFTPSTVQLGARSTLTFTIDNTVNAAALNTLSFVDTLPSGLLIAEPSGLVTDCGTSPVLPTIGATPGSNTISFSYFGSATFPAVAAGAACGLTMDVVAQGTGQLDNISGVAAGQVGINNFEFGIALDSLQVDRDTVHFAKEFMDDPVPPGGTATLEFRLGNFSRDDAASAIAFTDDLSSTVAGMTFDSLISNDCGGAVTGVGGTSIGFSGGTLPATGTCSIRVALGVPPGAAPGIYSNVTSGLTADLGGVPGTFAAASDDLFVFAAPVLTKEFLEAGTLTPDPVVLPGDDVVIRFSIDNTSTTSAATNIAFLDNLTAWLPFPVTVALPPTPNPPCGAGSSLTLVVPNTDQHALSLTNGNIAASGSCTFDVTLTLPAGLAPGLYTNVTDVITATVAGDSVTGSPASDELEVVAAPQLSKSFIDDPVSPGGTVTLQFELSHSAEVASDATGITFTDDLSAMLAGVTANFPPTPDPPCGAGSTLTGSAGDTLLTLSGGTLAPGETCLFSVTLDVPVSATSDVYTNTTSDVSATVSGLAVTSAAASDDLLVTDLSFSKEFTDDPVLPGDTVTLEFTIANTSATLDATGIFFTDSLTSMLSGAAAVAPLPTNPCGAGSSITGTTSLTFSGGNLTAGTSCTFNVTVLIPGAAANGSYRNTSSSLFATIGGSPAVLGAATDLLTVNDDLLLLQKAFTDDPVMPGDTVTLQFTLTNQDAANAITGIGFSDDLDAALSGLTAVGLPVNDVCGAGSQISGTGFLTLTGGNLAAGASCSFSITAQVPAAAASGNYLNTTSSASGTLGGFPVIGDPASDTLRVRVVDFSKSFDGPSTANGTAVLSFSIDNIDPSNAVSGLAFSDDLDAALSGLIAVGLPLNDVCGAGSQLSGTSFLTLAGGNLAPGASCSFGVSVQVPASATAGSYPNITSALTASGLGIAEPATADLIIEPPPVFAKAFVPDTVGVGQLSTLSFSIDNTASALTANALAFTDNLPAGMTVAATSNASTTCVGGTITATPGSAAISYSGGTVGSGSSCTLSVDVVASVNGALVNSSGDLTSSNGNSGSASDTLTVIPQPGFAKLFTPDVIAANGISTLVFSIDNTAGTIALTGLAFSDNLPAGMTVAATPNASTTCTGGTVTAVAAGGTIQYNGGSVAAGSSCTLQADVTAATPGSYANSSGALMSSIGTAGVANDTLTVAAAPLFSKVFAPNPAAIGQSSTLTFTIDNSASALAVTALDFTDNLPAGLVVATPANAATTCTGGTLTAVAGSGTVSYTGGSVAAAATCTLSVDTSAGSAGVFANTSGDLTSSSGNSGTASDTLNVVEGPLFGKAFAPASVEIGGTSTLTFSIDNSASPLVASALGFSDNLPAGMVVATPANGSTTCTGGTITAADGTGTISYTGGSVAAGSSCTISVDVQAQATGTLSNTTGGLTSSGGSSGTASADLTVTAGAIAISKAFQSEPVLRGGQVEVSYTIENLSASATVDNLAFTEDFSLAMPGWVYDGLPLPGSGSCGISSVEGGAGSVVSLQMGSLGPGASCTLNYMLRLPADAPLGTVSSTSSAVTGTIFGSPLTGNTATDTLQIVWLAFSKAFVFSGAPIPGNDIGLMFTISNPDPVNAVSGIGFTDDLDAAVPGMFANGLPTSDVCGAGSQISGSGLVTLSNGSLTAGGSCDFQISVHIPSSITAGNYTNNTSPLSATPAGGVAASGDPADVASASIALPDGVPPAIRAPDLIPTLDPRWLLALMAAFALIAALRLRQQG